MFSIVTYTGKVYYKETHSFRMQRKMPIPVKTTTRKRIRSECKEEKLWISMK